MHFCNFSAAINKFEKQLLQRKSFHNIYLFAYLQMKWEVCCISQQQKQQQEQQQEQQKYSMGIKDANKMQYKFKQKALQAMQPEWSANGEN